MPLCFTYKYYSYWNIFEYKDSLSSEGSLDEVERLFCVGRLRVKIAEQIFGHARPLEEIDSPLVSARTDTHLLWPLPNLLNFGRLLLKFSIVLPQQRLGRLMEPIQPLLVLIPQRPNGNMLLHPILQTQLLKITMPANRYKFIVLELVFKYIFSYFYTSFDRYICTVKNIGF